MEITLRRSLGSTRSGTTINVDPRLGNALVKAGHATPVAATKPARPKPANAPRIAVAPAEAQRVATVQPRTSVSSSESDLNTMLKSQLVEIANGLGLPLDGSETKADLITRIENTGGRYARRDMRAK